MTALERESLPCGPAEDGADAPHWEALREGRLLLPRCADCGTWRSLGRVLCASCHSFDTNWDEVRPVGSVFTWIRSHRDFMSELDVRAPYVTVLVELTDIPVRLLGILIEDAEDTADPAIGDDVDGVFVQPGNAAWPILRWRLTEGGVR